MKGDQGSNAQSEHYEDLVKCGASPLPRSLGRPCKTLRAIASLLTHEEAVISQLAESRA